MPAEVSPVLRHFHGCFSLDWLDSLVLDRAYFDTASFHWQYHRPSALPRAFFAPCWPRSAQTSHPEFFALHDRLALAEPHAHQIAGLQQPQSDGQKTPPGYARAAPQKFDTISPKFHFSRPSLLMNSSTYDDFQAKGKNYV
jgi:hypothetical protein